LLRRVRVLDSKGNDKFSVSRAQKMLLKGKLFEHVEEH